MTIRTQFITIPLCFDTLWHLTWLVWHVWISPSPLLLL